MIKQLKGTETDLGEFSVRRVLPNIKQKMIGPYIFFDHIGPANFPEGTGIKVRPHPHIGIATITYLFEGSILHRDNLGYEQEILPGDINWMTAGSGIVHSERETEAVRNSEHNLHGLQLWIALPDDKQEIDANFQHHPKETLPIFEYQGATVLLMAGDIYGEKSPVNTYSPMFYADVKLPDATTIPLPAEGLETGIYVIEGKVLIADEVYSEFDFIYVSADELAYVTAHGDAKIVLIGGEPFATDRIIWWNFVSNSKERIEQAKVDWRTGKFGKVINDEEEFIPLPDE